jgi:hypothetical protein
MEITHLIIFTNQILHKVFIVSTTKSMYQVTITQRIIVMLSNSKLIVCNEILHLD